MLILYGRRQYHDPACATRNEHEPMFRRIHARHWPQRSTQAANFDP